MSLGHQYCISERGINFVILYLRYQSTVLGFAIDLRLVFF